MEIVLGGGDLRRSRDLVAHRLSLFSLSPLPLCSSSGFWACEEGIHYSGCKTRCLPGATRWPDYGNSDSSGRPAIGPLLRKTRFLSV